MKDIELKNVKKQLNWKEKIVINIFPRTFYKVFYKTKILMMKKDLQKPLIKCILLQEKIFIRRNKYGREIHENSTKRS